MNFESDCEYDDFSDEESLPNYTTAKNVGENNNSLIVNKLHEVILQDIDTLFQIYLKKEIEDMKCFLINNIEFLKMIKHNNKYYFYLFVVHSKFKHNIKLHKAFTQEFKIKPNKIIYNKIKTAYIEHFDIQNIENIFEKTMSTFKGIILYLKILLKKNEQKIKKQLLVFKDGEEEINKISKKFEEDSFLTTPEFEEIIESSIFIILKIILLIIKNNLTDHKIELIINTSISIFFKCVSHICLRHTKMKEIYYLVFKNNKSFLKINDHLGLCYLFYYLDSIVFIKNRPKVARFMKFIKQEYQKINCKDL